MIDFNFKLLHESLMIVLIGVEKGGTGKTTLATNLAVIRKNQGNEVLLIDTDTQKSANFWATNREENGITPRIPCIQKYGKGISSEVIDLSKKFEDIIIDAGGRDSEELRAAMAIADHIFIPVQSSQFDIWTLSDMDELVAKAQIFNPKLKAHIVLNRVSTNPSVNESRETIELLSDFKNLTYSGLSICDRIAYRKASSQGFAITELKPLDHKANDEMMNFYRKVYKNEQTKKKIK